MRPIFRFMLTAVAVLGMALVPAGVAVAKGGGGIITLAAPIPGDAEPGSTLVVEFTAWTDGANGRIPVEGLPMVVRLLGPDGATTEAVGVETEARGTYRATIPVPAGGIDRVVFGMRGVSVSPDGTTAIADIPFEVDGVLLAMSHPNPVAAAPTATPASPSVPDVRPALLAALAAAVALGVLMYGWRRGLRPTS